jgi:Neuraminidase (sialidase)
VGVVDAFITTTVSGFSVVRKNTDYQQHGVCKFVRRQIHAHRLQRLTTTLKSNKLCDVKQNSQVSLPESSPLVANNVVADLAKS